MIGNKRQGYRIPRFFDLTLNMAGALSDNTLKLNAIATYGVSCFLVEAVDRWKGFLGQQADQLKESGTLLLRFLDYLKASPDRVPMDVPQRSLDLWKRFIKVTDGMEIDTLKTHLMFHLIWRMAYQGKPFCTILYLMRALTRC
jgi:hypothetical protein